MAVNSYCFVFTSLSTGYLSFPLMQDKLSLLVIKVNSA